MIQYIRLHLTIVTDADIEVSALNVNTTGQFVRGFPTVAYFTITLTAVPGFIEVLKVEEPNTNFEVAMEFSGVDQLKSGASIFSELMSIDMEIDRSPSQDDPLRAGLNNHTQVVIHGSASINIPRDTCHSIGFICANITQGNGSSYTEVDLNNNRNCLNTSQYKNCIGKT